MILHEKILNQKPFECDDIDILCKEITDIYDETWCNSLEVTIEHIKCLKNFKHEIGSWNVPLKWVDDPCVPRFAYKIFRKPLIEFNDPNKKYAFEFHQSWVPTNQWLTATVSGSNGLTGIEHQDYAKFHLLCDEEQAITYYISRIKEYSDPCYDPCICRVAAVNFFTVDLIYVPPKQFMWGIDARNIYMSI